MADRVERPSLARVGRMVRSVRLERADAERLLATARVGRLATVTPDGGPHVIPICFALVPPGVAYSAIDAKPKRTTDLQRVRNVERNPRASLLADHYDDDWTQLWWVRADGTARVVADVAERARAIELLAGRYRQYAAEPPGGDVLALDIDRLSGWTFE
jgi:PPOX class probable F420-dependent enzyme